MNSIADIPGMRALWKETYGDPRVCIAILDGAVDQANSGLRNANLCTATGGKLPIAGNGPATEHGTHVTSIIFGQHSEKVKGVAPGCRGVIIPVFKDDDSPSPVCTREQLAAAIQLAIHAGAQIINISSGQPLKVSEAGHALTEAIRQCSESGVLVVAAAGNEDGCTNLLIPGAFPSVLAVASSGGTIMLKHALIKGSKTREANCIFAPGDYIPGALPVNTVDFRSGSSYAAAVVSGVAALLLSLQLKYKGGLNALQVQEILLRSAEKTDYHPAYSPAGFLYIPGAVSLLKEAPLSATIPVPADKIDSASTRQNRLIQSSRWNVSPKALKDRYAGVAPEKFGTVDIHMPGKGKLNIPDLHYPISNGSQGMCLLPVSDDLHTVQNEGEIVPGYFFIDQLLRQEMHLDSHDPVYALLSYIRPEEHTTTFYRLPETKLKMSHQHVASYAGQGRTMHALHANTDWKGESLLNMKWNADRYPANVQILALQGVPQAVLNRNALIVDTVLTAVVKAPVQTEVLKCRTTDINTILQFYRDTIRKADYLEDYAWYTNCTVQKTIAINILLNVPHNEPAFRDIFGEEGIQLWKDFLYLYKEISGRHFEAADETHFVPLWKLEELDPGQIKPLTYREYNTFLAAKTEGRLKDYPGPFPLQPGLGMAWPLETIIDVIINFFDTYLDPVNCDTATSLSMLLFLRHHICKRAELAMDDYLKIITPVIIEVFYSEGKDKPGDASWLNTAAESFFELVKKSDEHIHYTTEPFIRQFVEMCIENAKKLLNENVESNPAIPGKALTSRQVMYHTLARVRSSMLEAGQLESFTTPSILHLIAKGAYRKSHYVTIRTVCTVMDSAELIEPDENWLPPADVIDTKSKTMQPASPGLELKTKNEMYIMEKKPFSPTSNVIEREKDVVSPQSCSDPDKKCNQDGQSNLVYAFGRIGYSFISSTRRDSIKNQMGDTKDPGDPAHLLEYLKAYPYEAASVQWTLTLEGTPIYIILPQGPFAREAYDLLVRFLHEQTYESVERVSLPGFVIGYSRIGSGDEVPVVVPEIRGMYSWTTRALVDAVVGQAPAQSEELPLYEDKIAEVSNFLERVYFEMRNLGRQPNERALNFAATNAFQVERIYENALREEMELDTIQVEPNPLAREGTDSWDVKLSFFFPKRENRSPVKIFRFTVDVSDVVPVIVGPMRSWFAPVR